MLKGDALLLQAQVPAWVSCQQILQERILLRGQVLEGSAVLDRFRDPVLAMRMEGLGLHGPGDCAQCSSAGYAASPPTMEKTLLTQQA
jgi:hypothetical protein